MQRRDSLSEENGKEMRGQKEDFGLHNMTLLSQGILRILCSALSALFSNR